jgi:hypothetical protein
VLHRLLVAVEVGGRRDDALAWLGQALEAGLSPVHVGQDPDLADLRADAGYHRLHALRVP